MLRVAGNLHHRGTQQPVFEFVTPLQFLELLMILSLVSIHHLNRLVKNVGYGRDTENILMMITPRIVINEEEEIIQTGVISNPALIQTP